MILCINLYFYAKFGKYDILSHSFSFFIRKNGNRHYSNNISVFLFRNLENMQYFLILQNFSLETKEIVLILFLHFYTEF